MRNIKGDGGLIRELIRNSFELMTNSCLPVWYAYLHMAQIHADIVNLQDLIKILVSWSYDPASFGNGSNDNLMQKILFAIEG